MAFVFSPVPSDDRRGPAGGSGWCRGDSASGAVRSFAAKLGVGEQTVRSAIGIMLNRIKENAGGEDTRALLGSLRGAEALLGEAAGGGESSGGGLMRAVASGLGGMLGGGAAGALGALGNSKGPGDQSAIYRRAPSTRKRSPARSPGRMGLSKG